MIKPDRDVRPFQDVLIELGARLQLPGLINATARRDIPASIRIISSITSAARRRLAGRLARRQGGDSGTGAVNPRQLERLYRKWVLLAQRDAGGSALLQAMERAYLKWAVEMGFLPRAEPIVHRALQRDAAEIPARRARVRRGPDRRRSIVHGSIPISIPADLVRAVRAKPTAPTEYRFHAITQRPMAMYHAWGSQNAWLRQIHGENRLHINRATARTLGIADGDWVKVTSAHSSITVMAKLMDGVNPNTVWTWNAIGKRSGAWNLARERRRGDARFLAQSSHPRAAPPREGGYRYANADPVTGQAAWYDLRVRIEKAAGKHRRSEPAIRDARSAAAAAASRHPALWRTISPNGKKPMTALPDHRSDKRLGLVIDLDICVGCHACAVNCKEWNSGGVAAPLTDLRPYDEDPLGVWFNRIHSYETGGGDGQDARCIFRGRACIATSRPASRCARPAPATSAPKTASCWSMRICASAASSAPGLAPTARGNMMTMPA